MTASKQIFPYLGGINYESLVDGPGVRTTLYLSGCPHNCPGCQNPDSHYPNYGVPITYKLIEQIADEYAKRPFLKGITLSGGDPFYDPPKTLKLLTTLAAEIYNRTKGKDIVDIWIYTGYTFETLPSDPCTSMILLYASALVDGPFIEALADKTLKFRGSSNQRIIDLPKTIEGNNKKIILHSAQEDA